METIFSQAQEKVNVFYQVSKDDLGKVVAAAIQEAVKDIKPKEETAEPRLISVEKTMELVDVSRTTLFHWNRKKILEPVKIGRTVKYRYNDVVDFINKGERK